MTLKIRNIFLLSFFLLLSTVGKAQERPFIWVAQSERAAILEKIEKHTWAGSFYDAYVERLQPDIDKHMQDVDEYLSGMPLDWDNARAGSSPPLKKVDYNRRGQGAVADTYMHYLQVGIDCGVMYYLTQEEKYARCALDILNTIVLGIVQLELDENKRIGGWLYASGQHLREAREIGAQIPIIYDLVKPYIDRGGMPYHLGKRMKADFPHEQAQHVFYTYAELAVDRGMTGSNWSVLEAPSLVQNALALENITERNDFITKFMETGSDLQDPLRVIAEEFKYEGDVYPETSQYSNGVASLTTYMLTILTKYDSTVQLGKRYKNIPLALSRWEDMKYPNSQIVRFGDGHRYGGTSIIACEAAYYLGEIDNVTRLIEKNGTIINTAIAEGKYTRGQLGKRYFGARPYFEPLNLLWFAAEIEGDIEPVKQSRTDDMPHASLYLQRNLSETQKAKDGLMCFVAGAHMVHGHASGMHMELYGKGYVLGVDNGRGRYRQEIHENYSRIFAAHNTVIVNGSSQSDGGWVNLGMNPVQLVTMEPLPKKEAVSNYHSFTQTSFVDDKGDKAEAIQQRTMALIRTSPTSGYYVDVFRSKSALPNEYHDYLYHNIGDELKFLNEDIELFPTPDRYMANADQPWVQNRQYRHPGWHYFKDVQTSLNYDKDLSARFIIEKLGNRPVYMDLHVPGEVDREYTKVLAPHTYEAPEPYLGKPTPTLVIRKRGEAWKSPFVIVYEPFDGTRENNTIRSVDKITDNGIYKGLIVTSRIKEKEIVQYIISQDERKSFKDNELGISFNGTFAIITTGIEGKLHNIYMGDGTELNYRNIKIYSKGDNIGAYLDVTTTPPVFKSNDSEQAGFYIPQAK